MAHQGNVGNPGRRNLFVLNEVQHALNQESIPLIVTNDFGVSSGVNNTEQFFPTHPSNVRSHGSFHLIPNVRVQFVVVKLHWFVVVAFGKLSLNNRSFLSSGCSD
jgi:hypothetical protein